MGKKARATRQATKAKARALGLRKGDEAKWMPPPPTPHGFIVDELGEIRRVVSKAEARGRFLRMQARIHAAMHEVMDLACKRARDELHAIEDAQVFADIDRAMSVSP